MTFLYRREISSNGQTPTATILGVTFGVLGAVGLAVFACWIGKNNGRPRPVDWDQGRELGPVRGRGSGTRGRGRSDRGGRSGRGVSRGRHPIGGGSRNRRDAPLGPPPGPP